VSPRSSGTRRQRRDASFFSTVKSEFGEHFESFEPFGDLVEDQMTIP
jgi:hypothetical protein